MKFRITSIPALIAIIAAFSLYGYATTPSDTHTPSIRYAEWTLSHGLIGLGLALNLLSMRFLSTNRVKEKIPLLGKCGLLVLLCMLSTGLLFMILIGLNRIELGEDVGSLFSGDSGFAVFSVLGWSLVWSCVVFFAYLYEQLEELHKKNSKQ